MLRLDDRRGVVSVDIIIVNWNAGLQLHDCLKSIVTARRDGFTLGSVVLVDNASNDNSLEGLDTLPLPLTIIHNQVNRGFGAACNQGAALCKSNYILFLNPDTELFETSLIVPLAFMEGRANQKVGICGIQLIDKKGHVACTCSHFPSLWRLSVQAVGLNKFPGLKSTGVCMANWDHLTEEVVDQVIGAFFLVRRKVFEALGGFDERFYVYFEEVDISLRAKKMGWQSTYLSSVQAFHHGGGTSEKVKATRLFYSLRSRLLYGVKHFYVWQAWVLFGVTIIIEPAARVLFCAVTGDGTGVRNTFLGYRMLWKTLPAIMNFLHSRK